MSDNEKISVVEGAKASGFEFKRLGTSGLKVSPIALGCASFGNPNDSFWPWTLDYEHSKPFFKRALEAGINFFDTANIYSAGVSEEITGRCLRELAHRDEIVVATKCYFPFGPGPNQRGLSRKAIFKAVEGSLKRLDLEYIDLLQIHRWDDDVSFEETMRALHDLVQSGKVRYIGASSMPVWQFAKCQFIAEKNGWTKFISMQNHYNLLYREEEREMIPFCKFDGVALIPWSPLAGGLLTRPLDAEKTKRSEGGIAAEILKKFYGSDNDKQIVVRVQEIAAKLNIKPAQLGLAWHWAKGIDAPIIGATKLAHLDDAIGAIKVKLSAEDVAALEELYLPRNVTGTKTS